MKVDKSNLRHWVYLLLFGIHTAIAIILRPLTKTRRKKRSHREIILYGHRLSGNLLALHRHIIENHSDEFRLTFLTMDPACYKQLCDEGIGTCLATRPSSIGLLSTADAVISDHGLHSMAPLLWFSDAQFFDVWHGIPFKGFDEEDFKTQHRYTETWVTSPLLKRLYVERFGFCEERVIVTGYARTDRLINATEDPPQARKALGLPPERKLVLFAPTWAQDAQGRSIFPFGMNEAEFMRRLSELAAERECSLVLRPHLNTPLKEPRDWPHVYVRPSTTHPDTEAILLAVDVLVCDWSSIAFDFLLLDRPTIFLGVEPPFRKGFSLGAEYRFDRIVGSMPDLESALVNAVEAPEEMVRVSKIKRNKVKQAVYANYADGQAAQRGIGRLRAAMG